MTVEAEIRLQSLDSNAGVPASLDPGRKGKSYGRAVAAVIGWLDEAARGIGLPPLSDFVDAENGREPARSDLWHSPSLALPTVCALLAQVRAEDEGATIRPGPHYLDAVVRENLMWDLICFREILEEAALRGDRFRIVLC